MAAVESTWRGRAATSKCVSLASPPTLSLRSYKHVYEGHNDREGDGSGASIAGDERAEPILAQERGKAPVLCHTGLNSLPGGLLALYHRSAS